MKDKEQILCFSWMSEQILSWMMDEFIHWPKPYFLLWATCDDILSWMIENWMKNRSVSETNWQHCKSIIPIFDPNISPISRVCHNLLIFNRSFLLTSALNTETCVTTLLIMTRSKLTPSLMEIPIPYRLPTGPQSGIGASTRHETPKVVEHVTGRTWKP